MTTETEDCDVSVPTGPPWYLKIFEYMKNRNRIGPGKVELPECDFFIVGPRRTLRVLIPTPKGNGYYETTGNERPETIDENFISRWAIRPHPSGNCRCSFRQSNNRMSTNEERIICAEINRIRSSLCEAEKSGEDIEELEQRISLNLEGLNVIDTQPKNHELRSNVDEKLAEIANVGPPIGNKNDDDLAIKNKIVRDLENYIEVLLQEVLNDTMKFFSDAGDTLKKSREALKNDKDSSCNNVCIDPDHLTTCKSLTSESIAKTNHTGEISVIGNTNERMPSDEPNSFDISFAFHAEDTEKLTGKEAESLPVENDTGGYVNRAFTGTTNDPDSLDFDLRKPVNTTIPLDNLDCIDSGINSVETIEFQPSQEPSLEQSLMEIIDAKLGRAPMKRSWEDLSNQNCVKVNHETISMNLHNAETSVSTKDVGSQCDAKDETDVIEKTDEKSKGEVKKSIESSKDKTGTTCSPNKIKNVSLEDDDDLPSFDKSRLEIMTTGKDTKKPSAVSAFREKFNRKFGNSCRHRENIEDDEENSEKVQNNEIEESPVELRVKREKVWHEIREPSESGIDEISVKFRKSRKPTIVFLHGFGSSAEIFEHQLEYFSNLGYPCIAPEMLGHGMSSAPDRSRDYHFDKLLKDLETILQHYAFRAGRKCVLVAHNYGCSFATALACKYDSNIHQLVLISGGGPTPLAPPSTEGAGHCCLRAMLTPLLMCGLHRDILYSARGRQHPYCGPEPPEQWPSHMKYVLDGMVWPEGDYVFHRRICTPTLLIHGLRDNKVSLVQECQMERTIIKAFLDAIPTAGHTPMTDCPEQVNHMIHCFIDLWKRKKR